MILVFILGYGFIVLEHVSKINKAAVALFTGAILWTLLSMGAKPILSLQESVMWLEYSKHITLNATTMQEFITHHALFEHLGEISSIVFFLMGAMTIVEVVDRYQGFRIITEKIDSSNRTKLLWVICILTFFMSAILDNLTTTIVMVALLRKIITDKENRWLFSGMVVVAANAGGAWSPMGDVTTIMLWIGGQVTAFSIITKLILPSFVTLLIPLLIMTYKLRKEKTTRPKLHSDEVKEYVPQKERNLILLLGILALVSVPIFKTYTHLPPFIGMLLGLSVIWIFTERRLNSHKELDNRKLSIVEILHKIDSATILFFLGILISVAALQTAGHLDIAAVWLNKQIGDIYAINLIIGVLSAIVDNVPLVAASIGMYPIADVSSSGIVSDFAVDGNFWTFLAYCVGTGGSILIVGSAAGVAAMGMENIPFMWYLKKIGWLAAIGYFSGAIVYLLLNVII